jgi:hypothetical protein
MAHACNPNYLRGRDQEDRGLKLVRQIVLRPYLKKTLHKKRAGGVAQGEHLEFKPQYHKKYIYLFNYQLGTSHKVKDIIKNLKFGRALVAHACNSSYSNSS